MPEGQRGHDDKLRHAEAVGITPEELAELDEIYGYVPPEKRGCRHPNLAPAPTELTRDVASVAAAAGAIGFGVERRCPDCGAWVAQPQPNRRPNARVVLFDSDDSPGTTGLADATIAGVGGDMILSVRDIDATTGEVLGDPGYRWRLVVKAADRPELVRRLELDCDDYYADQRSRDNCLLAGIWRRFGERASGPSEFRAWLDQERIRAASRLWMTATRFLPRQHTVNLPRLAAVGYGR